jgi:hypothetical protein
MFLVKQKVVFIPGFWKSVLLYFLVINQKLTKKVSFSLFNIMKKNINKENNEGKP